MQVIQCDDSVSITDSAVMLNWKIVCHKVAEYDDSISNYCHGTNHTVPLKVRQLKKYRGPSGCEPLFETKFSSITNTLC